MTPVLERVIAAIDGNTDIDDPVPVGPLDRVSKRIRPETHLEFVDDLNDEFGLVFDADTILELDTALAIADHVSNKLARIHVN